MLPNVPSNHAIPGHQKGRDIHVTTNEVADLCRARQKMGYEPAYGGDFDRLLQELPIGRAKAMYGDDVTV